MNPLIHHNMTVKEINIKYPACREVFDRYGMGGCGGHFGPPEPLFFFAAAHHAPLQEMMAELEDAAQKNKSNAISESGNEKSMNFLYKLFIWSGIFFALTFGTLWGVIKLTQIAYYHSYSAPVYSGSQAHGHAQTWGWVGLFIMGVAYYAVTKFKNIPLKHFKLAYASFYLIIAGILLRSIAQPLADQYFWGLMNILSGILELGSVLIFAGLMIRTFRLSDHKAEFYEKYILASIGWFIIVAAYNLGLVIQMTLTGSTIIPQPYNSAYLHMIVFGFIVNMILGFSLRILPSFIGLKQTDEKMAIIAFYLFNLGVIWRSALLPNPIISSILELTAILLLIYSIKLYEKPANAHQFIGVDNAYTWFIKIGYLWLVVTGVMIWLGDLYQVLTSLEIPHAYIGAYRHAITVGFITTLMMGVGYRILPIFNGTELFSNKLMRVSFWLILVGNLMRVFFQLGTLYFGQWSFALMGISGYIELTGLTIFGINIIQTLRATTTSFVKDRVVRAQTKIAEIIDIYPELKDNLVELGFHHLAKVDKVPGFVTLKFAAQRHGLDPEEIIQTLNQQIQSRENMVHA